MRKNLENCCTEYENFTIIGDSDFSEDDESLYQFMCEFSLENVVKVPTCFKSNSPTCIDLVLTSDKRKICNIKVIETELSDFHVMVTTTLIGSFYKKGPRIIAYRDYSKFNNISFREMARKELNSKSARK